MITLLRSPFFVRPPRRWIFKPRISDGNGIVKRVESRKHEMGRTDGRASAISSNICWWFLRKFYCWPNASKPHGRLDRHRTKMVWQVQAAAAMVAETERGKRTAITFSGFRAYLQPKCLSAAHDMYTKRTSPYSFCSVSLYLCMSATSNAAQFSETM